MKENLEIKREISEWVTSLYKEGNNTKRILSADQWKNERKNWWTRKEKLYIRSAIRKGNVYGGK